MKLENRHEKLRFARRDFPILWQYNKGRAELLKDRASVRTWHEEIEIKFFTEGTSTLLIDTNAIVTKPGDIVVINPFEFHSTLNIGETTGVYHLLMIGMDFFSSKNLDNFDMKNLFLGGRVKFNNLIKDNPQVERIIKNLVDELQNERPSYELAVRGLVLQLFALLLRDEVNEVLNEDVPHDNARVYKLIEPAVEYIRSKYYEEITVEKLAALCRMSKYHFCRIFKRATNMTMVQYLTEYKLSIADIMLKNYDMSIAENAHVSGFDDESYFSRCYKKSRGISPQKVRSQKK